MLSSEYLNISPIYRTPTTLGFACDPLHLFVTLDNRLTRDITFNPEQRQNEIYFFFFPFPPPLHPGKNTKVQKYKKLKILVEGGFEPPVLRILQLLVQRWLRGSLQGTAPFQETVCNLSVLPLHHSTVTGSVC